MMTAAILKLESFDRRPPPPPARFTQADLDAAVAAGEARARAAADADARAELAARVAALDASVRERTACRAGMMGEVVGALKPVLDAFADGALPVLARARMQAAVLAELERLSDSAGDCGTAALRCGPDDAALLQDWLGRAGCAVALDPTGAPGTVDLAIRGGRVCFDHAAVTQGFRDLFRDFMDGLTE